MHISRSRIIRRLRNAFEGIILKGVEGGDYKWDNIKELNLVPEFSKM
jgi:hypothetical protein